MTMEPSLVGQSSQTAISKVPFGMNNDNITLKHGYLIIYVLAAWLKMFI